MRSSISKWRGRASAVHARSPVGIAAIFFAGLVSVVACAADIFACAGDADCSGAGRGSVCAGLGHCAHPDPECPSGLRYSKFSGNESGRCVMPAGPAAGTTTGDASGSVGFEGSTQSYGVDSSDDAGPPSVNTGDDAEPGSSTSTTAVAPDFESGRVLLVVDEDAQSEGDAAIAALVTRRGFAVDRIDDDVVGSSDGEGCVAILVSATVDAGSVGERFRDVPSPVVLWEDNLFDDMGMSDDDETQRVDELSIVDDDHTMAAGLSGIVSIFDEEQSVSFATPGPGAFLIAQSVARTPLAAIFGYEAGDPMPGGTAAGLRIGLFLEEDSILELTDDGFAMVEAALDYALVSRP